jgi:hypothetical protein
MRARAAVTSVLTAWTLSWASATATAQPQETSRDQGNTFAGSWSAVGRRQTLRTETGHDAAIIQLSGTLVITRAGGAGTLPSAFRAEAIGFAEGDQPGVGRAVWTDSRGDVVFSTLNVERLGTGRRVIGTITGGTGRYAALAGEWDLTWQFVVETEDGEVQGRAADVKGRFRRAETRR